MKPSKSSLIFILLGLAGILAGITFKLNHLMGAHTVFNIGIAAFVIGLLLWVVQLVKSR